MQHSGCSLSRVCPWLRSEVRCLSWLAWVHVWADTKEQLGVPVPNGGQAGSGAAHAEGAHFGLSPSQEVHDLSAGASLLQPHSIAACWLVMQDSPDAAWARVDGPILVHARHTT